MAEALGLSKDLLFEMINDHHSNRDEIRVLRTRFQSYVDTFGREAIEKDLAKPESERQIILAPEMADCARLWLEEPTSIESSERMIKVLMVSAVFECAATMTLALNLVPWVN